MEAFLAFLFFVALIMLIIGLFSPNTGMFWSKGKVNRKKVGLLYGAIMVFTLILSSLIDPPNATKNDRPVDQTENIQVTDEKGADGSGNKTAYTSELLENKKFKLIDNFWFLIHTNNTTAADMQNIALDLKKKNCTRNCNIHLYTNKISWQKEKELREFEIQLSDKLTNAEITLAQYKKQSEKWYEENVCDLAEYYVASLIFEMDSIWYFPYKDDRYTNYCGEKANK